MIRRILSSDPLPPASAVIEIDVFADLMILAVPIRTLLTRARGR
jgi:hypothetical protein